MSNQETTTKDLKLFSQRAIYIGTFVGGPLAAGYLIRANYRALGKSDEGNKALVFGVIGSILLFAIIFSVPESAIERIPRQLIPLVYTAIVYFIVERIHGDILRKHKEDGNPFFSRWRVAGISLISLAILSLGILGYVFISQYNSELEKYDVEIEKFTKNETETLVFYDHLNTDLPFALLSELDNRVIPKWQENIEIIKRINKIENLPSDLAEQNSILLKYSELRLEAFQLFRNAISQDTDLYRPRLEQLHHEIDLQLEKLNS